ncbi:hypothetical protein M0Q97_02035 [Candidatus Dojkabacteria bacterium]|jgi:esterase/lipase|nr:hypothetical protein [Candidatus Dojkabacteria bacterium]
MNEYFNNIQDFIKNNTTDSNYDVDEVIKSLKNNNIQAVINQCYHQQDSVEDCVEKILKMLPSNPTDTDMINQSSNHLTGDRGSNTMERKILKYDAFIREINS